MNRSNKNQPTVKISTTKLFYGALILLLSFLAPLLIPFILKLEISSTTKAIISSVLLFGVPEIGMILAIVILGDEGYNYLKSHLLYWLKDNQECSRIQHRVGITLFSSTLILGFIMPYIGHFFPTSLQKNSLYYYVILDLLFFVSLIILGENFWRKLKALFFYN